MNGNYYEGSLSKTLDFEGFGYIGNKNRQEAGNEKKGFYGLFNTSNLIVVEFDSSPEWHHQIEFLKSVDKDYFMDSAKYLREKRPDIKEYPWLKFTILNTGYLDKKENETAFKKYLPTIE